MGKKVLRVLLWFAAIEAVFVVAGLVLSRRLTRGDENSDDFQVAAIFGGRKFTSHAGRLMSGSVIAAMGGIELDLRDAVLDPAGADLDLRLTMGGVKVIVPDGWAVVVVHEGLGDLVVKAAPPETLPEDAPRLHIHAVTRFGGGEVVARAA